MARQCVGRSEWRTRLGRSRLGRVFLCPHSECAVRNMGAIFMAGIKRLAPLAAILCGAILVLAITPMRAMGSVTPSSIRISVSVSKQGIIDTASRAATISGTVSCSRPAAVFLQGDTTQTGRDGENTYVHFSHTLSCLGVTEWSIMTTYSPERFSIGWVTATAEAEISEWETAGEYAYAETSTKVRLRPGH